MRIVVAVFIALVLIVGVGCKKPKPDAPSAGVETIVEEPLVNEDLDWIEDPIGVEAPIAEPKMPQVDDQEGPAEGDPSFDALNSQPDDVDPAVDDDPVDEDETTLE